MKLKRYLKQIISAVLTVIMAAQIPITAMAESSSVPSPEDIVVTEPVIEEETQEEAGC